MEKKQYNESIKNIKKLLNSYIKWQKKYKGHNLSGSGWQYYASSSERQSMYARYGDETKKYEEHNERVRNAQSEIETAIEAIIENLLSEGFTKQQIMDSCFKRGIIDTDEVIDFFVGHSPKDELDRCFFNLKYKKDQEDKAKQTLETNDNQR